MPSSGETSLLASTACRNFKGKRRRRQTARPGSAQPNRLSMLLRGSVDEQNDHGFFAAIITAVVLLTGRSDVSIDVAGRRTILQTSLPHIFREASASSFTSPFIQSGNTARKSG